jgi:hypothetical protein
MLLRAGIRLHWGGRRQNRRLGCHEQQRGRGEGVCVQVLQGGKFLPVHHSQNANLNHFRILLNPSTNHIDGTSVFPLFGFHTPTAVLLCSPGPWTDTLTWFGSWAKNRSKLLLAACCCCYAESGSHTDFCSVELVPAFPSPSST